MQSEVTLLLLFYCSILCLLLEFWFLEYFLVCLFAFLFVYLFFWRAEYVGKRWIISRLFSKGLVRCLIKSYLLVYFGIKIFTQLTSMLYQHKYHKALYWLRWHMHNTNKVVKVARRCAGGHQAPSLPRRPPTSIRFIKNKNHAENYGKCP